MFDKLDFIVEKYKDMSLKVSDPDVIADQPTWQKYIKDMGEMEPIVKKYEEYKKAKDELAMAKEILETENDEELRDLAKLEVNDNEEKIEVLSDELRILLIPKDPNDDKNVIVLTYLGFCINSKAAAINNDVPAQKVLYKESMGYLEKAKELDPNREKANWSYPLYQCYYVNYGAADQRTKDLESLLNK